LVTKNLIDNKAAEKVTNINFTDKGNGFQVTLSKTPESAGFYTDKPDGDDHYTIINIRMDIEPVKIDITPLKQN
jgi:hypothetical protein